MTDAHVKPSTGGRVGKLHTDPGCPFLPAGEPRVVDPERWPDREWCRRCTGDCRQGDPTGDGHYRSLIEAAGGGG